MPIQEHEGCLAFICDSCGDLSAWIPVGGSEESKVRALFKERGNRCAPCDLPQWLVRHGYQSAARAEAERVEERKRAHARW